MRTATALCTAIGVALAWPATPVFGAAGESPAPELSRFYFRLANGPRVLSGMVRCLINQDTEGAQHLFDLDFGSPALDQATAEFHRHGENCLSSSTERLQSTRIMFVGAVAEQLIVMDKPPRPTRIVAPMASIPQPGGGTHLWTWRDLSDRAEWRSLALSYCLLERHPDQVEAVLDARSHSDGEREVFNGLKDEIDSCIPRGENWTLQPQIQRSAFAIAYYQSARAAARLSSQVN